MNLKIIEKKELRDGVIRYQVKIPSSDFLYTGFLLESFEGVCTYTTPDKKDNIMQIDVVADQHEQFLEIFTELLQFNTKS